MPDPSTPEAERLYERVRRDLDREHGASAWLRSRSTRGRAFLLSVASLALVASSGWMLLGPERVFVHGATTWLSLAGLVVLAGLAMAAMLRPLYLPAWSGTSRSLLVSGIGLGALASIAMVGDGTLGHVGPLRCLWIGATVGAPIFGLALLVDRQPRRIGVFRALVGGLVGGLAVQLVCPGAGIAHLLVEHFGTVVATTALFVGLGGVLERSAGRTR